MIQFHPTLESRTHKSKNLPGPVKDEKKTHNTILQPAHSSEQDLCHSTWHTETWSIQGYTNFTISQKIIMHGILHSPVQWKEMDLITKWLGKDSSECIRSTHVNNPRLPLSKAWERLRESYAVPEILENHSFSD